MLFTHIFVENNEKHLIIDAHQGRSNSKSKQEYVMRINKIKYEKRKKKNVSTIFKFIQFMCTV